MIICSCSTEKVPDVNRPSNAHEAYLNSLEQANLLSTALGKDWLAVSQKAISDPVIIDAPYQEILFIDSLAAFAEGYRFSVKEGQEVNFSIDFEGSDSTKIFIDAFRVEGSTNKEYHQKVASGDQFSRKIKFTSHRNLEYIIRLQVELLRGGKCIVTIQKKPILNFPVEGKNTNAIQSFFGDPRDGGKRKHRGVDIFASRHTPVYAPIDGYTQSVGESEVGGLHVWFYNPTNSITLYFAHLQTIESKSHTRLKAGDLLGTVGNTGNAKTTPPHLHFGIYGYRRAINPYYYLKPTDSISNNLNVNERKVGNWAFASKNFTMDSININKNNPLKILAANYKNFRVMNMDKKKFIIPHNLIDQLALNTASSE
jgi:peptidoglycan LD-endopeptidase LytH